MSNERPILFKNVVVDKIIIEDDLMDSWPLKPEHSFGELGGNIGDTWNGSRYIKPVVVVVPTPAQVESERRKRIIGFLFIMTNKKYTWEEAASVISEATREATTLLNKKVKFLISNVNPDWTNEQATRAASLESMSNTIDILNAKAKILSESQVIPSDYTSNTHWTLV